MHIIGLKGMGTKTVAKLQKLIEKSIKNQQILKEEPIAELASDVGSLVTNETESS